MIQNSSSDPAADWNLTHDVKASGALDVREDSAAQLLVSEPDPEVLFLLGVSEASYFCKPVHIVRWDLIGSRRLRCYPDIG